MDFRPILTAALMIGGMGLIFGALLAIVGRIFRVEEDPRKAQVRECLPGANCGGCGYAGCDAYAAAVVNEGAPVNRCPVGGEKVAREIAAIMGVEAGSSTRMVATVLCQGDADTCKIKFPYEGLTECRALFLASGGDKACKYSCLGLGSCAKVCDFGAITVENRLVHIDPDKCKGCGRCIGACNFDAIYSIDSSANEELDRKMAEYAAAVCAGRPCFHISLVQDISPNCDCHGENDAPILPDIGMFASFDPVALDQACADACLNAQPLPNSQLGQNLAKPGWNCHHDNFKDSNPNIEWKATLDQAEKVGMGTRQYVLKKV